MPALRAIRWRRIFTVCVKRLTTRIAACWKPHPAAISTAAYAELKTIRLLELLLDPPQTGYFRVAQSFHSGRNLGIM